MTSPPFRVERLTAAHDRAAFDCGVVALNVYFRTQASQDERRRVATCFVAVESAAPTICAGYYTLSAAGVELADLPAATAKKLPRYPTVPVVRLGRLAIGLAWRGRGLGSALLWDALSRAASVDVGAYALLVDAKDEAAAAFYAHHEFLALADRPLLLFRPLTGLS